MGEGDCGALQARLLLSHQARLLPRQARLARFLQARFHQARVLGEAASRLGEAAAALRAEGGVEVRRCGGAEVWRCGGAEVYGGARVCGGREVGVECGGEAV